MVKKIFLLLALMISLTANVEAADEDLPFDVVAAVYPEDKTSFLALIKMKPNDGLGFMVAQKGLDPIGLVPYSRKTYDFYLATDEYVSHPPLIFTMIIANAKRGQADDELGAWKDDRTHVLPVYAMFDFKDGQVICEKPFYSASELNASHYQAKIQNAEHERLIEIFMTYMPHLQKFVAGKNISLP